MLELDTARTALVVIDMTKRVLAVESQSYPIQEIVERTAHLARAFRQAGSFVVLVRVYSIDGKDVLKPILDASAPPMPDQTTAGWSEFVPELGPQPTDYIVTKHQWGAFFGTDLDLQLRRRGIETIILCGIATNIGVETTAREAYQHGYNQVLVTDAMTAYSKEEHEHSCKYIFPRIGRLRPTNEVIAALQK